MSSDDRLKKSILWYADQAEKRMRAVEQMQALDATAELERIRSAAFDAFGDELADLKARLEALEAEVATLRSENARLRGEGHG
jgi:uncharacterized protein YceH (UPF0502 family)